MRVFADFHVHVGEAQGRPVKITASRAMTVNRILSHATQYKGIQVVTLIDGVCPPVQEDLRRLLATELLVPARDGGYLYDNRLLVLLGAEVEAPGPRGGAAHFGCWFESLEAASAFSSWLSQVQLNVALSSQRVRATAQELQRQVKSQNGIFVVHHAFTPHKGLYGSCVNKMSDMVNTAQVDAVELGLSADTDMADCLDELQDITLLSNSDAHSVGKIAREYNEVQVAALSFQEVRMALGRQKGRRVTANFGLDPRLGKYHRACCSACGQPWDFSRDRCQCKSTAFTNGVYNRWLELRNRDVPKHPPHRPHYVRQIPLEFIPGLGPKLQERLVNRFKSEMNVLHLATEAQLAEVCGSRLANLILRARAGELHFETGGGGTYGRLLEGSL